MLHFHFNISTHRAQQKIYGRWRYVRETDVKLLRFTPQNVKAVGRAEMIGSVLDAAAHVSVLVALFQCVFLTHLVSQVSA